MSKFRPEALVDKFGKLTATQQSIETISQWCIFFRKEAKNVVHTWDAEFNRTGDIDKKLALIYLANDILQNSRKKGPQFVNEFYHKLPQAIAHLMKHGDEKLRSSMARMIQVWEERRVFGSSGVKPFTDLLEQGPKRSANSGKRTGSIVLQTSEATIERWQAASADAAEAEERCAILAQECIGLLQEEDGNEASSEDLRVGLKSLQQYTVALQNVIGHHDRVLELMHNLLTPQENAKQVAESQLLTCQLRVQQLQEKLEVPIVSTLGPDTRRSQQNEDVMEVDTCKHNAGVQKQQSLAGAQDQADGGSKDLPHQINHAQLSVHSAGEQAKQGFSAADLVAQLSQTGGSAQMLLDALAALPKVQPEVRKVATEEEYDPEVGL